MNLLRDKNELTWVVIALIAGSVELVSRLFTEGESFQILKIISATNYIFISAIIAHQIRSHLVGLLFVAFQFIAVGLIIMDFSNIYAEKGICTSIPFDVSTNVNRVPDTEGICGKKSKTLVDGGPHLVKDKKVSIYFSQVTFTTLGYGDYRPSLLSQRAARWEAMLGYAVLGLFVATIIGLVKKYPPLPIEKKDEEKKEDSQA